MVPPSSQDRQLELLGFLCTGDRTAAEVATALGMSANGARWHLARLEEEGLVEYVGVRGDIGKPARVYRISDAGSARLSKAYVPLLGALLDAIEERVEPEVARTLMEDAARRVAASLSPHEADEPSAAEAVAAVLRQLGGVGVRVEANGVARVRAACCPLRAVTTGRPGLCRAVAAVVGERVGAPVRAACDTGLHAACDLSVDSGAT